MYDLQTARSPGSLLVQLLNVGAVRWLVRISRKQPGWMVVTLNLWYEYSLISHHLGNTNLGMIVPSGRNSTCLSLVQKVRNKHNVGANRIHMYPAAESKTKVIYKEPLADEH